MKTMIQKPELKEGQVRAAETVELNANEVQAVSGGKRAPKVGSRAWWILVNKAANRF